MEGAYGGVGRAGAHYRDADLGERESTCCREVTPEVSTLAVFVLLENPRRISASLSSVLTDSISCCTAVNRQVNLFPSRPPAAPSTRFVIMTRSCDAASPPRFNRETTGFIIGLLVLMMDSQRELPKVKPKRLAAV